MIVVHAVIPIDPDAREEALDLAGDLAERSREESGVIDYRATTDLADPNTVHVIEQYESEAALGAHGESEHFTSFSEAIVPYLAGEPDATRFDVAETSTLDL